MIKRYVFSGENLIFGNIIMTCFDKETVTVKQGRSTWYYTNEEEAREQVKKLADGEIPPFERHIGVTVQWKDKVIFAFADDADGAYYEYNGEKFLTADEIVNLLVASHKLSFWEHCKKMIA